jgi:3-hydroxybutyryl-CoA dehydrogenase
MRFLCKKKCMKITVITDDSLKEELLAHGLKDSVDIEWANDINTISKNAGVYIDLLFDTDREKRKETLCQLPADLVIVNDVTETGENLPVNFIRINGWPTFLKRAITEASCNNEAIKEKAERTLSYFNKKIEWIQDVHGFVTPRVICMIINEAFFSLQDKVSSRDEIDIAMKLGTNYPYGPFEWSRLIGLHRIYSLLSVLSEKNTRYTPCDLLKKELTF